MSSKDKIKNGKNRGCGYCGETFLYNGDMSEDHSEVNYLIYNGHFRTNLAANVHRYWCRKRWNVLA